MPLPKSCGIAAKATEVYAEIWSVIVQQVWSMSPTREDDLSDLSCLLPYLRQLLTCCACAGLLENAMISLSCGHCYCCQCQYQDPLLKIQCRQCRDRTGLVVETQLRIVVDCYKHVCCILADKVNDDPVLLKKLIGKDEVVDNIDIVANENENESSEKCRKKQKKLDNPIVEILREIQDGVKVSRAVLVIKPPQKYLTPRTVTPKGKELQTPLVTTKTSRVPKLKCAIKLTRSISSQDIIVSQERQQRVPRKATLVSHKISGLRRRKKRKTILGNRTVKPVRDAIEKKRPKARRRLPNSSSAEESEVVDVLGTAKPKPRSTEEDVLVSKLSLDCFDQKLYDVSLDCLDSEQLHITPEGVNLKENIKEAPLDSNVAFEPDTLCFKQSEDGTRERLWNHMCPRLKARRSRAIIDKTIILQEKVAHGAIKTKNKEAKSKEAKSKEAKSKETKSKEVKSKEIKKSPKTPKKTPTKLPPIVPPPPFTPPPPIPTPTLDYEPPLPDDLSGLVLEKLEGEDPLPYIDKLLFRPPPVYHPLTPHFHHMPPLPPPPPPPHFSPSGSLFGPMPHPAQRPFPLMIPPPPPPVSPLKTSTHFPHIPVSKTPTPTTKSPSTTPRKRRTPGYSEDGWRCRCGTNNVMFPEKVCAKGKCPCFSKGIPCKNCLCKHCHNPNNK